MDVSEERREEGGAPSKPPGRSDGPLIAHVPRSAHLPPWLPALIGALVLAVSLFPRVWNLAGNPPALAADELAMVVSWESIARTGHDLDGSLLPFTYNRIERHPPLYGLILLPAVLAGHRGALAIRLPAAVLGVFGLALLWALGNRLLQSSWGGVAAMTIMSFTPWHIHYSRIGWTPALTIPMLVGALLVWVTAMRRRGAAMLGLAAAALAATIYGYKVFDALAPLWLVVLLLVYRRELTPRRMALIVVVFALVYAPLVYTSLRDPLTHARARSVFIFSKGVTAQSLMSFAGSYVNHFSPGFLFERGDPNLRHHAPGTGQLPWWMAPLMVAGAVALARRSDLTDRGLLVAWLLIYPLGGALTNDQPVHATRTLLGLPALSLLAAVGLLAIAAWIGRQPARFLVGVAASCVLAVAVVAEGAQFATAEFLRYPTASWWWWDYGQAEIFQTLWARHGAYDRVCLGTVFPYHEPTYRAYYLQEFPLPVYMKVSDPACVLPGTLVALDARNPVPAGTRLERAVYNPLGERIYVIFGIPRR